MITVIFVAWTVIEYISLLKSGMWYKLVRDKDERIEAHAQKAGYITFWINMIGNVFMFVLYSYIGINKINLLNYVGIMFIISIISFIGLKTYFIHEK
ncbi:MAG: hypothetical protein ACREV6_07265 [Clostridium sp.]|uniref:hypothetical protein n=1 Tax=Clostridium sp. TaxID=1506 RepID=UPI003D6C70A0